MYKNWPSRYMSEIGLNEILVCFQVRDRLGSAVNSYFTDCGIFLLSNHRPSNADLAENPATSSLQSWHFSIYALNITGMDVLHFGEGFPSLHFNNTMRIKISFAVANDLNQPKRSMLPALGPRRPKDFGLAPPCPAP